MTERWAVHGVVEGVFGRSVTGWAVAVEAGTRRIVSGLRLGIYMDGALVAELVADQYRPEVAKELGTAGNCGFSFYPPVSSLKSRVSTFEVVALDYGQKVPGGPVQASLLGRGQHEELRRLHAEIDALFVTTWTIRSRLQRLIEETESPLDAYYDWALRYDEALLSSARRMRAASSAVAEPTIGLVCVLHRPDPALLDETIESVIAQEHRAWELHLVDDGGGDPAVEALLERHARRDPRIIAIISPDRVGRSAAASLALPEIGTRFVGFLGAGDLLSPAALAVMARAIGTGGKRLIYSDEDEIDAVGHRSEPHLKGAFDRRHLLEDDCVGSLLVVERGLLTQVGSIGDAGAGAEHHDLVLRLSEHLRDEEIAHVPEILYHRRRVVAAPDRGQSAAAARAIVVGDHLERRGLRARIAPSKEATTCAVSFPPATTPPVSILVPYRDEIETTRACVEAVLQKTRYPQFEIVLIDNWSTSPQARDLETAFAEDERVRFVRVREPFNYSRINNLAASTCTCEHYVFMNNDVLVEDGDWLTELVGEAQAAGDVGIVGAMLVYPDGSIQHAGVALGIGGCADHVGRGLPGTSPGHRGRHLVAREQSAVTAALMLCRATTFSAVGGFDETDLAVAFNDVDLCLKARSAGWRVLWTPRCRAIHHESLSRPDDLLASQSGRFFSEIATMRARWGPELEADPFYNPHFSRHALPYRFLGPSRPVVFGSE